MNIFLTNIRNWYGRYERPLSSISLIGGFAFDALTLDRVDVFWQNIWAAALFIIVAASIILINRDENAVTGEKANSKMHFWYLVIQQFFFGGLLSAFVILYFRSTTLLATWPFLLILLAAFIANESFKKHYSRLIFQVSLFFLSLFAFAIFIVPIIFHRIGPDIFLISGAASLAILLLFLYGLKFLAKEKFEQSKKMLAYSIAGIYLTTNILYFANLIPPIPLSLREGGVYHSIYRNSSRKLVLESEKKGALSFLSWQDDFHAAKGAAAYAYSAVFSPELFNINIVHNWQKYDSASRQWSTIYRIGLPTAGGRDNGYRTYSYIKNIAPGQWRVNVETENHQIIGRLRFNVIETDTEPILTTEVLK